VRDLGDCRDLVEVAVLLVRFFLVARDEPLVEPLHVRDFLVAGDDSLVLGLVERDLLDGRNKLAPTLLVVNDGILAGYGGRVDAPHVVVMHDVRVERLDDALRGRGGRCAGRCYSTHECECGNSGNGDDGADTDGQVFHWFPLDGGAWLDAKCFELI